MRILEVAGSGTIGMDEMGPVSSVICNLSNHFNKLDHTVTVVDAGTTDGRPRISEGIALINVDCRPRAHAVSLSDNKYHRILKHWLNEYRFIKNLIAKLDLSEFHIVHSHEWLPTFILQKTQSKDCVYTSHTPSWSISSQNENLKANLKGVLRIAPRVEKSVIKKSLLTVALGDYLKKNVPHANIEVIPNGIDLKEWTPIDKSEARKNLGFSDRDFILIFVGRISPVKGVDILIKSVRSKLYELDHLKVIIVGSLSGRFGHQRVLTSYSQRIVKEAQELPVCIKGFINNKTWEFRNYLAAADLAIVPSMSEAQGLSVLEALAMSTPVIASNIGGIPQMVNELTGCLFEPGNSLDLSNKVLMLYNDRDKLESMSRFCRKFVQMNFTWDVVARRYLAAFERIMSDYPDRLPVQS